jgi:chaperone BCS1
MITAIACMLGKDLIMVDCATQLKTKKQLQDLLDNYGSTCIIVLEDFDRVPSALIVSNVLNASTSEEKGGSVTSSSSSNTATEKNTKEHLGRLFDAYANCPTGTANEEKRKELLKLYNDELKNRETNQDLDLSFLLNKLDGPQSQPGRMIFLTANHPERIESALRRPGRIDYEVEFSRASRETVAQILCRFFRDSLPTELMDAVSSLSSRYEKEEEDVTSENAILENETLSEEKVQKETGKGKEKGKEKEITKLTTFFDTVKDGKFTHSQIYAVCKKYNDLYKVVDELSQSHLDLSSVSL